MNINEIYLGDCLDVLTHLEEKSIDMILCDLPYGVVNKAKNEWDVIIPFDKLWLHYNRVIKNNGAIVLFGQEPFSSKLRLSNLKDYKYDWFWEKDKGTGFLNAKRQPLRKIENIHVFYKKQCTYNPQFIEKDKKNIRPTKKKSTQTGIYGQQGEITKREIPDNMGYPVNIVKFNSDTSGMKDRALHPTQKPLKLLEYLVKTYTNQGDLVLDNCMGSGSTAIACINTDRNWIGIEKDEKYYKLAKERIRNAKK